MNRMSLARRSAAVLLSALVVQASSLTYFHSAAWAQSARPIGALPWVDGKGAPDGSAHRFVELLETELRRRDTLSLVALPKGQASARKAPATASAAGALLDEGQQKLADLQFDVAAEVLRQGISAMTATAEQIDWPRLLEAYVSLAVASFRRGDEEGAQKALGAVVRLAPDYTLPEGRYPPIFVREYDKARRRSEKMPKGSITVDGPPGAVAWVDGRDLGMVPVVQENLAPGTHYVKVEGTRGELFGATVELRGKTAKVDASFNAGAGAAAVSSAAIGPVLDDAAHKSAQATCEATGAQFAVVGVLYRSGDHQLTAAPAVYSAKARAFVALPTATLDDKLLTANVEIFRLVDAVEASVQSFGRPVLMGHDLAAGATWAAGTAVATGPRDVVVPETGGRRSALTPSTEPRLAEEEDGRLRALGREGMSGGDPARGSEVKSGSKWWLWTLVGVGVVAAAGGTAYGVHQATQPVTGTVTARW